MAKQLDCTASITSTQNNGIHGIHFGPDITFSSFSRLANKQKLGWINISGMDWTTSKSIHSNHQMRYERSTPNSISGSPMIVILKMTHISSDHYTTEIFSNLSRSIWHRSHFRCTSILYQCALLTLRVAESSARWAGAIGHGILSINFAPERRLGQS